MSLKRFRRAARYSQAALADLAGISQGKISHLEAGRQFDISLRRARRIVRVLNSAGAVCTLDDVFPPEADVQQAA